MKTTAAFFTVALAALTAGSVQAAGVDVLLDHSARLPVNGAASVIVSNPQVADVTVVDSHTVYVSGRGAGSTNIIVLDRMGRAVFSSDVNVVRTGMPVAVYHGIERTDFTCSENCAKNEKTDANPFTAMIKSAMAANTAQATPGSAVASAARP